MSKVWIENPRYDQFFLLASWAVPWVLLLIAFSAPHGLMIAFLIFLLIDTSHLIATFPLSYFDRGAPRRSRQSYFYGTAIILTLSLLVSIAVPAEYDSIWQSLVLYWGGYHIARQHYGFLRLYQSREKPFSATYRKAEVWAFYSGLLFPYLMGLSQGWMFQGEQKSLFRFPAPEESAWACLIVFILSLSVVFHGTLREFRAGKRTLPLRLIHLLLAVSNFWIGILWIGRTNLYLATLFVTSYHDVQYSAIVWLVGQKRFAPKAPKSSMQWVFRHGLNFALTIGIFGALLSLLRDQFPSIEFYKAIFGPSSNLEKVLTSIFLGYTFVHYWVDGKIWKFHQDPRLAKELG